ncbi:MAG: cation transporter [Chlamydiales bacterium 38-26]|nr:CusA/CzcA family heavy metal efflux RND transporter [Chlamydiales bacterium]OJV09299.1 MAG: cation transporter [Chlamydiales bacterium 38-26]
MIERILRFSIYYPLTVITFILFIAGFGIYSFTHLPIDAVPDITNNQVQINTILPGFSPVQMEKQVTYVIENALAGIPGLQMTRSLTRNAFSQVTAIFDDDVNIYFARQQIGERLNEIKENLPDGADPRMGPLSTGLGEVYMWTVNYMHADGRGAKSKDGSPGWQNDGRYLTPEGEFLTTDLEKASYLRTIQDWLIKPQLKGIKGVAGIDSIGGYVKQYHVEPNLERMVALGLSFSDIISSIKKNNTSVGSGYIENKGESLLIKSDERLDAPKQIETIVLATREGVPLRIKDIANVGMGKEMRTGSASKNGQEVVIGTALMLIGANSRTVSQAVDNKLKEINQMLPPDIEANSVLNRTKLVNATIKTVASNLIEGAILVIAVLFLFLGQLRAAFVTALVIPLSMLMTATGMVQAKISGNLMSLGALDFGLIVDGAVIITENCLRRLTQKQHALGRGLESSERLQEILEASKEMIQPTVYGQLIIMTVYIPILTLSGVEGKMFHPMAMTVIFALIAAFILSLTFVPAMIAIFIKGYLKEKESSMMEFFKRIYAPVLQTCLKFPWTTVVSGLIIFLLSLTVFFQLGQEFVPTLDEKDIAMHAIRIPSTSLTQSTEMQMMLEATINKLPQVAYVYSKTGTAEIASDPMPPNVSDTFIILKPNDEWPDPSLQKSSLIEIIQRQVNKIPGSGYEFTQPIEMRFNELISGVRSDVAVKIYGDDFEVMEKTAEEIAHTLRAIPGSADVKMTQTKGLPVLDVDIDRDVASRLGINVSDALDVLSIAAGGGKAGQLFEGDRRFDIQVRLPEIQRHNIKALANLPIPLPNVESSKDKVKPHFPYVPLGEIAHLKVTEGLNEIRREDGKRFMAVQANVRGRDLGSFVEEAKKKIVENVQLPHGYWMAWGGQFENLISARQRLLIVVPICLSLIFLLLYTALNSLRQAVFVFTGIPLALTGGILALWMRDMPFSISAAVGFIALSGIAVLNGLVLITCINQIHTEKKDLEAAIKEGALVRLRPVLMTALVASLGFVPMALATGTGAEVQKPLATVVIGGLISSTILTLLLLPALYRLFPPTDYKKSSD